MRLLDGIKDMGTRNRNDLDIQRSPFPRQELVWASALGGKSKCRAEYRRPQYEWHSWQLIMRVRFNSTVQQSCRKREVSHDSWGQLEAYSFRYVIVLTDGRDYLGRDQSMIERFRDVVGNLTQSYVGWAYFCIPSPLQSESRLGI
jgi:hypothetical protein